MKKLTIEQMEMMQGGQKVPPLKISCGASLVFGLMVGGIFGPVGALVVMGGIVSGKNCLDLW